MSWLIALALLSVPPDAHSYSLGNASDGNLIRGEALSDTPSHKILRGTRRRGYHHGTQELVGAIGRASAAVAESYPGSRLLVGNMSRRRGGDIGPSASHNSGRDADLGFYMLDSRGRPITGTKRFRRCNRRGRAGKLKFDPARNWALVKALLTDTKIQVQWIFVADWLRDLLLAEARRQGASDALLKRAQDVLGQPANSSPHAEHFHVRLYCSLHERLWGCRNYGPLHAWADHYVADVARVGRVLIQQLGDPSVKRAAEAAVRLGAMRAHQAVEALAQAISDPRTMVRREAVRAVILLDGAEAAVPALVRALTSATDRGWRHRLVGALARTPHPDGGAALQRTLGDKSLRDVTRKLAARGLGRIVHSPSVPLLIGALGRPGLRSDALESLRRITNRSFSSSPSGRGRWRQWWRRHAKRTRTEWVLDGFRREHSLKLVRPPTRASLKRLVELVRVGGVVGANARDALAELTGHRVEQGHFSAWQLYRFYRSWLGTRAD